MSQREIPMQDEPEIEAASFYDMRDACKDARVRWAARFRTVRAETERRAAPLSSEDQSVQSMPDASPIKWHRAHTTWFVEHFLIGLHALGYRGFDERFAFLFNSYCVQAGPRHGRLIEFGSGSSTTIRILLGDLPDLAVYVPIDVSAELLAAEADALRRDFSRLKVRPVVGDFMRRFPFPLDAAGRPRVGFFPGSTIGNFDKPQAAAFLAHARDMLGVGSSFILGVDLAKDEGIHAAYDDVAGVTTRFSLNMLARINRKIGANIVLQHFAHRAFFNTRHSRIEMHLVSRVQQDVEIGAHRFTFERGKTIHTENSYRYTIDTFQRLARSAGWMPRQVWTDPDGLFSVHALSG